MNKEQVINNYLEQLQHGNYDAIAKLFDPQATINSPFFGRTDTSDYLRRLPTHVKNVKIENPNLFEHLKNPNSITVYLSCNWTFQDGSTTRGDCVCVFEFLPNNEKIKSLNILFDASKMPKYSEKPLRKSA